jgi:hypothetical protein
VDPGEASRSSTTVAPLRPRALYAALRAEVVLFRELRAVGLDRYGLTLGPAPEGVLESEMSRRWAAREAPRREKPREARGRHRAHPPADPEPNFALCRLFVLLVCTGVRGRGILRSCTWASRPSTFGAGEAIRSARVCVVCSDGRCADDVTRLQWPVVVRSGGIFPSHPRPPRHEGRALLLRSSFLARPLPIGQGYVELRPDGVLRSCAAPAR